MIETKFKYKKVAIVYDRVNKFGGAERVLLALHDMFPDAPLYTSVYDDNYAKWASVFPKIYTSFLQNVPFAKRHNEYFGWLMPIVFEGFDFKNYDLVISVTSEAAKGVITNSNTKHVCLMLTPTRYLWSGYDEYFENPLLRSISKPIINYLRWWDKVAAMRPDKIVAISTEVKSRIKKYYDRDSQIIFPPVDLNHENTKLQIGKKVNNNLSLPTDYYLYVGRLVKYKRVDLLIEVFNELNLPLVIVGSGPYEYQLKSQSNKNVKFLGQVDDKDLRNLYQGAKAFLMQQFEDFGITSVEAQGYGIPVIAYGRGGSIDTVVDEKTGIMFNDQTKQSLIDAIKKFDTISFDKRYLITNAKRFSKNIFKKEFIKLLNKI